MASKRTAASSKWAPFRSYLWISMVGFTVVGVVTLIQVASGGISQGAETLKALGAAAFLVTASVVVIILIRTGGHRNHADQPDSDRSNDT